jgi:DsbC/DsbD-like thiol-disulfide interchange protein
VAAVSYDSVAILRMFSDRVDLNFPLLADPDSAIIKAFGIVNTNVDSDSPYYGFPWAGYYLLDHDGVVTAKFFNEANNDRTTAANILVRQFGADAGARQGQAKTKHLTAEWSVTNETVRPGQRGALILDVKLKPGMHLYAPGEHGYIAVEWPMEDSQGAEFMDPAYPEPETMYMKVIDESVPVYAGDIQVVRDLHMLGAFEWPEELQGRDSLEIQGEFRYQACDDEACYPPVAIPLKWTLKLEPHDKVRVPDEIRRGADSSGGS